MTKIFIIITILLFSFSCSNEINYSGKIINQENLDNINFKNKEYLLTKLGSPSYIDPIENKYFYFTEKNFRKSIFKERQEYSYIFVFNFDENDKIIYSKVYDIKDLQNIENIKFKTDNNLVKRGLIERIFGGVGTQRELPTSP